MSLRWKEWARPPGRKDHLPAGEESTESLGGILLRALSCLFGEDLGNGVVVHDALVRSCRQQGHPKKTPKRPPEG